MKELNSLQAIDLTCDLSRSSDGSDISQPQTQTKQVIILGNRGQPLDIDTTSLRTKSVVGCITDNPKACFIYDVPLSERNEAMNEAGVKRCSMRTSEDVGKGCYYREIEPQECVIPHLCTVCWVNDHMYCAGKWICCIQSYIIYIYHRFIVLLCS